MSQEIILKSFKWLWGESVGSGLQWLCPWFCALTSDEHLEKIWSYGVKLMWYFSFFSVSVGLAVSNRSSRLLVAVCHSRSAEGSVWVTWRPSVLSELCRRLFSLDFSDHGEGLLLSVCVWRLCGWSDGVAGGSCLHRRYSVDPGRTWWTNADKINSARGAVFIPRGVGTATYNWVS